MTQPGRTGIPASMPAVVAPRPGGPEVLRVVERPVPEPGAGEVLIRVRAAGINRPDLMQRSGAMAPPPGATDILGLEAVGEVVAHGPGVALPRVGETVMALTNGGAQAGYCLAPAAHCLPAPASLTLAQSAGAPEALFTLWHNLFELGRLAPGETVLIHGAASGLGTLAVQLARACGATAFGTAGGAAKTQRLRQLGAALAIDHTREDFVQAVLSATHGRGADVVLDIVGGPYLPRNLQALAPGGRHVSLSFMQGAEVSVDLQIVMRKALTLTASTLRPKSIEEKTRLALAVRKHLLPLLEQGRAAPVVHATLPLDEAAQAHRLLESNANIGKVVLMPDN